MGQYHILANLDKNETVNPHALGLGAKQYEHTGCEGSLSDALYLLVMTSNYRGGGDWPEAEIAGRWVGDRVVVLGDYTEDSDLPPGMKIAELNEQLETKGTDITKEVVEALTKVWDFTITSDPDFAGWATRQASSN